MNTPAMEYKGYRGSVEFSEPDGLFFGKVQGIRSLISYEGADAAALMEDFHTAVDDYLISCAEDGMEPEIAKSMENVRISLRHMEFTRTAYAKQSN